MPGIWSALAIGSAAARHPVASDTFTRADNAATLGNAETGQPWSALAATWGIIADQAYTTTSVSNAVTVLDAAVADALVQVTTVVTGTDNGVVARASDVSNYLRFIFEGGVWYLQKMVAGALSTIASAAGVNNAGDVVSLECRGSTLTARVNGTVVCSGTDAFNATATKWGMATSNGNARLDNFQVTS